MFKDKKGFSLLELLTVLAITIIISVTSYVYLYQRRNQGDVTGTAQEITAILQDAQSRAMSGDSSTIWGVYFDNNATAASPFYAMFPGATYVSSSAASYNPLPPDVCFTSIASGASTSVTFSMLSGLPSASTSITLQNVAKGCTGSSTIGASTVTVSAQGVVTMQ